MKIASVNWFHSNEIVDLDEADHEHPQLVHLVMEDGSRVPAILDLKNLGYIVTTEPRRSATELDLAAGPALPAS